MRNTIWGLLMFSNFMFAQIPTNGLVAFYPFNGNANDESGNGHNGTVTGASLSMDRFGNYGSAFSFNGTSDQISIPHSESLNLTGDLTFSAWFQSADAPTYRTHYTIMSKKSSPSMETFPYLFAINYQYGIPSDYQKLFFMTASSSSYQGFQSTTTVPIKKWNHAACVVRNDTVKLFLNNTLVATGTLNHALRGTNSSPLLIGSGGRTDPPAEQFKGLLDDMRIYDRALSTAEVAELYNLEKPTNTLQDGIVAFYPFSGNANDESGNGRTGTVQGAGPTIDRFGRANEAYSFDGINDYIIASADGLPLTERTVSMWFVANNTSSRPALLAYGGTVSCGNSWLQTINAEGNNSFMVNSHCNLRKITAPFGTTSLSQWHNWIATTDTTGTKMYLDGTLITSNSTYFNNTLTAGADLAFGTLVYHDGQAPYSDINSGFLNGKLDDIRIYSRSLSSAEVQQLYSADTLQPVDLNDGLVAYYPFNGNANDESANNNAGTVSGATLTLDRFGVSGGAYHFNGTNAYIQVNDSPSLRTSSALTISAWVRQDQNAFAATKAVIVKGIDQNYINPDYLLVVDHSLSNYNIRPHLNIAGGWYWLNGSGVVDTTRWCHIAMTYDGSTMKTYLDGMNDGSQARTGAISTSAYPLSIGTTGTSRGLSYFPGDIDDIRIYNRALSSTEIESLFHEGGWAGNSTPAAPKGLAAVAGSGQVTLKWNKNTESDFLSYCIYRGTSPNPTTKVDSTTGGISDTTKTVAGLTNGTMYYFRITAVDSVGFESGYSNEVSATPVALISFISTKVTGGTFQMGSTTGRTDELPVHTVTVSSFNMDKYEVTYEKWTEVRSWGTTHGYADLPVGRNGYSGTINHPVTEVNWYDALKWCNARSEMEGLTPVYYADTNHTTVFRTGNIDLLNGAVNLTATGYRLPTEAEWEFAARGGALAHGYDYSGSNDINAVAWYSTNSGSNTHPVGKLASNELGLFDMSGNVWEWCWDWYGPYSSITLTNPLGPTSGSYRTLRGGSWFYPGNVVCRVAGRDYGVNGPSARYDVGGFRCVQTVLNAWVYTNTGISHTIIIPTSANPTINGSSLRAGDYIGAFYDSSGTLVCSGYERWTGTGNIAVSAFGDDPTTPAKDGLSTGEVFKWKVLRMADNKIYDAEVRYAAVGGLVTHTSTYSTNGISQIEYLAELSPWKYANTGISHTVIIPATAHPTINGLSLNAGDYIGAFYDSSGSLVCAGYEQWTGTGNIAISAFGDDPTTPAKDGLSTGEVFKWKVFRESEKKAYEMDAAYAAIGGAVTHTNFYATNGISQVIALRGGVMTQCQSIRAGWSLVATYVTPLQASMDSIFQSLMGDVIIVKNGAQKSFIPAASINTIGPWVDKEGYQIKLANTRTLCITGKKIMTWGYGINLPSGWSIMPYVRDTAMSIVSALSGIVNDVIIVKDQDGKTYIPSLSVNSIGTLKVGQGYQIKMTSTRMIEYPASSEAVMIASDEVASSQKELVSVAPPWSFTNTGISHTIIIPTSANPTIAGTPLGAGDYIGVFYDSSGTLACAGFERWTGSNNLAIAAFGDDATTTAKDGLGVAEAMKWKIWRQSDGLSFSAQATYLAPGSMSGIVTDTSKYTTNGISAMSALVGTLTSVASDEMPSEYTLMQNYPNPFNPTTTISYALPQRSHVTLTVSNALGQQVAELVSGEQDAGYHNVRFDATGLASGVYLYRLQAGEYVETRKLILLR